MKSLELNFHFMGVTCIFSILQNEIWMFPVFGLENCAVYNKFRGVKCKYFFFCLLAKDFITLFGPICYLFEILKCVFASVDSENNGLILLLEYIF